MSIKKSECEYIFSKTCIKLVYIEVKRSKIKLCLISSKIELLGFFDMLNQSMAMYIDFGYWTIIGNYFFLSS